MNEHLFQLLLVLAAGGVGALPGVLRSWRSDAKAEGASGKEQATLLKDFGKLEQRVGQNEGDIQGVAKANRELYDRVEKRLDRMEKKGVALEGAVTGKMPRVSGEGPTNG